MSQYLDDMKIGSKIDVAGPVGRIVYKRNGINIKDNKPYLEIISVQFYNRALRVQVNFFC